MKIILDTSVWIEYFKRNDPFFDQVQAHLNMLNIKIIDPVIGEILQGALNQNEINFIQKHIQYVPKIETNSLLWTLDKKIVNFLDEKYLFAKTQ